ncbi:MAG: MBG domain-containing protein, partial [Myxococcota bacterium]
MSIAKIRRLTVMVVCSVAVLMPGYAGAATLTVTSNADSGAGTLRDTIGAAAGGDTIVFSLAPGSTISLLSPITVSNNVTVSGPGASVLAIDCGHASRAFSVITGTLTLNAVTIQNCMVSADSAFPDDTGGGVYVAQPAGLTVEDSTFINNQAGNGGAIFSYGTLIARRCTFQGNHAARGTVGGGGGGGVHAGGTATVENCDFNGNTAEGSGAGMLAGYWDGTGGGLITITGTTFRGNVVSGSGGTLGTGGGLQNQSAAWTTISNSTFDSNMSNGDADDGGGGIMMYSGGLALNNVTLTRNTTTTTADYMAANPNSGGAGISATGGERITIRNSIIAGNTASGATDRSDVSGNFVTATGALEYNLVGDNGGSTGFVNGVNGNIVGDHFTPTDGVLGLLGDYGGTTTPHTWTVPLLPGSPVIDKGSNATCAATDQRGISRPQNATCDMGSFESRNFRLENKTGDSQEGQIDSAFPIPLGLTVTALNASEPVMGGKVTLMGPAAGAGVNPRTVLSAIRAGGTVSQTVIANSTVGGWYTVFATANGAIAPALGFSLKNKNMLHFTSASSTSFGLWTPGSFTVSTDGTTTATSITLDAGPLPAGVSFTYGGGSTATLSGTPASGTAGQYPLTFKAVNGGVDPDVFQNFTLTVDKAPATVTLGSLTQTYNGSPRSATATTDPVGLTVNFTYDGSGTAPTNAGSYAVIGTISDT